MHDDLERQIRQLRRTLRAAGAAIAGLALLSTVTCFQARAPVDDLRVHRLTVVNEGGLPALVIAGQGRLPGPTVEGREYPQELSGGRTGAAGFIFFNERGDEVGGLTFQGDRTDDGFAASGLLAFDQFQQDQVVAVQYQDDGASRSAGLRVWDRSTEVPIQDLIALVDGRRTATGAARDSIESEIQDLADQGLGAQRVFLGSRDRTAGLHLFDRRGRVRLRMVVDTTDAPRLELLDSTGAVVRAIHP